MILKNLLIKFLPTSEPSIPNVNNFALSIRNKYVALLLSYNEVLNQITKWNQEIEDPRRDGLSSGVQGILLAIKYETYLNSIYSLYENLSFLERVLKKFDSTMGTGLTHLN